MNTRVALAATVITLMIHGAACGQVDTPGSAASTIPRTAWGDPDLQGVYTFATPTPLVRPDSLGDKDRFTDEEIAELDAADAAAREADIPNPPPGQLGASYNAFWTSSEKGRRINRTSLIVDPPDGRMPPLTERGEQILADQAGDLLARQRGEPPFVQTIYNTWRDLTNYQRCLARPMPRIRQGYNHGVQILQTPDHVVIHYESMHDIRIIPLDGRPQLDDAIRLWNGDSRGRWEGDTLVVEWTNFTGEQLFDGGYPGGRLNFPQDNMRFIERFTRVNENALDYQVTVDDPTIWTQAWTFVLPWVGNDPNYQLPAHLYEFACHEGNYRMMEGTLRGSRASE